MNGAALGGRPSVGDHGARTSSPFFSRGGATQAASVGLPLAYRRDDLGHHYRISLVDVVMRTRRSPNENRPVQGSSRQMHDRKHGRRSNKKHRREYQQRKGHTPHNRPQPWWRYPFFGAGEDVKADPHKIDREHGSKTEEGDEPNHRDQQRECAPEN
jgi:hypothetical protein